MKTTDLMKKPAKSGDVEEAVNKYLDHFNDEKSGMDQRVKEAAIVNTEYYALATDFYLHGWGRMFHFGVRRKDETLKDSLMRHETRLVERLQLKSGQTCLDLGCGVGGPMINIAKQTRATITGINNSLYQIEKGRQFVKEEQVKPYCQFMQCDWMDIPLEGRTFDKAYTIEATCHADSRANLFAEVHRLLKPGALFAGYEWVMTDKYDENNAGHREIKRMIEIGNGVANLKPTTDVTDALKQAGFEIIEARDMAFDCDPETPWHLPLKGGKFSFTSFRTSPPGRFLMRNVVRFLEALRILPKGTLQVNKVLDIAAEGLVKGADAGIFTPMYFFLARKV